MLAPAPASDLHAPNQGSQRAHERLHGDELDPPETLTTGCVGGNLGGGEGGGLIGGEGGNGGSGDGGGEGDVMFSELAPSCHEEVPKPPLASVTLCTLRTRCVAQCIESLCPEFQQLTHTITAHGHRVVGAMD